MARKMVRKMAPYRMVTKNGLIDPIIRHGPLFGKSIRFQINVPCLLIGANEYWRSHKCKEKHPLKVCHMLRKDGTINYVFSGWLISKWQIPVKLSRQWNIHLNSCIKFGATFHMAIAMVTSLSLMLAQSSDSMVLPQPFSYQFKSWRPTAGFCDRSSQF